MKIFTTNPKNKNAFKKFTIKTIDNRELSLFEKQLLYVELHCLFFNYLFDLLSKAPKDLEGRRFFFYCIRFLKQYSGNL